MIVKFMRIAFFVGLILVAAWIFGNLNIDWAFIGFLLMTPEAIATFHYWNNGGEDGTE